MSYVVKVPKSRKPRFTVNRMPPRPSGDEPPLTGFIGDEPASDIEERFSRGLRQSRIRSIFQYELPTLITLPNRDNKVDFLIEFGGVWSAVEIDGEIGHKTLAQKENGLIRDIFVNEELAKSGIRPIVRVPWHNLENQEAANRAAREVVSV
jgi:hypothetical protein